MKEIRISLVVLAAVLLAAGLSTTSYAFHSGGVAECEGCHSMHSPAAGGTSLLVGATPSEACLTCHEKVGDTGPSSYHVSTADADMPAGSNPLQRTPGGDFGWLKRAFTYTYGGETITEYGGGHKINAPANGYPAASGTAPGGTFSSADLGCHSCHDPHGKYRRDSTGEISTTGQPIKASGSYPASGNEPTTNEAVGVYRLLAGASYAKAPFTGVPAAKVPSSYNASELDNQVRVAYGVKATQGHVTWGTWCATCHGDMHSTGNYVHVVDHSMGSGTGSIGDTYNEYVKSGDLTGSQPTSFWSLVPFSTNSGDYATVLAPLAKKQLTQPGPTDGDQVSCLSCHRAHASGFAHMLRFDFGYEFMTKGGKYIGSDNPEVGTTGRGPLQSRGRTIADWQAAYYDRPATQFATYQRVLCNKCHAKD